MVEQQEISIKEPKPELTMQKVFVPWIGPALCWPPLTDRPSSRPCTTTDEVAEYPHAGDVNLIGIAKMCSLKSRTWQHPNAKGAANAAPSTAYLSTDLPIARLSKTMMFFLTLATLQMLMEQVLNRLQ